MAYSVRARAQEIGVLMALGASAVSVFRMVIGDALRLVLFGAAAGLVGAMVATRVLARLLFEIAPLDPWTFALTAGVLLAASALAAYLPARRAMRLPPIEALRAHL